jgi:hypothetical protein
MGAQANIGLGQQEAQQYGVGINQINGIQNQFMKNRNDLMLDRQKLAQEYEAGAAHLDPNQYIKNMSTGGKILTGLGLILGGAGAGLSHQPNLAYNFLQTNIDRDIENQRAQLGVKKNLLDFNLQQSGDLAQATNMTKLNSLDMIGMQLKRMAAQATNPQQQAQLLNTYGQLDQKAGDLQNQIAIQKTYREIGMGGTPGSEDRFQAQNNMLRMMGKQGEDLAKNRESHHIPGMPGQSSVPVSDSNQQAFQEMTNLEKTYQDAQDYLKKVGSSGAWDPDTYAEGQGIQHRMLTSITRLEDLKRFSPQLVQHFKEMTPNLTGTHMSGMDQEKLNSLNQELQNQMTTFKQGYGYNPQAKTPTEAAPKTATANEVARTTKDGKIAIFDAKSKKFLRYK